MANKNKSKGTYHERRITEWFKSMGLEAQRQPLSGSLGGDFSGDIRVKLYGNTLKVEVKYRDLSGFPNPFKTLEGNDFAVYKRRKGKPQSLIFMTTDTFQRIMENTNATTHTHTDTPSDEGFDHSP